MPIEASRGPIIPIPEATAAARLEAAIGGERRSVSSIVVKVAVRSGSECQYGFHARSDPSRHRSRVRLHRSGRACRRFFFSNAMLELLWLEDEAQARSDQTRATRLWERLSSDVSPFGIILRPAPGSDPACPWMSWSCRPQEMPGLELEIAADTELEEPMWCYLKRGRAPAEWPAERRQPLDHPAGFREITRVLIGCRSVREGSVTSIMAQSGVVAVQTGREHSLELEFDGGSKGTTLDFRPTLPLILRA